MANEKKDIRTSVESSINKIATKLNRDYEKVLIEFGHERILFRLSKSRFQRQFVLKGGLLVSLWSGDPYRLSKDMDFLAFADNTDEKMIETFSEILAINAYDGLEFDLSSIVTTDIMLNEQYTGKRVRAFVKLNDTKVLISIDIGFGDALPFPDFEIEYPSMLGFAPARVRAYSRETVIAEKFHAIVKFGRINTRMKDYYDLWILLNKSDLDIANLKVSIESTFERRGTELPVARPLGLSKRFATRAHKVKLWSEFSKNTILANKALTEIVTEIWEKYYHLTMS